MTPPDAAARASGEGAGEPRPDVLALAEEMIAEFSERGHPGRECLRTGWISVGTVERWRAALRAARAAPEGSEVGEAVYPAEEPGGLPLRVFDGGDWAFYPLQDRVRIGSRWYVPAAALPPAGGASRQKSAEKTYSEASAPPAGGEAAARERALEEAARLVEKAVRESHWTVQPLAGRGEEWTAVPGTKIAAEIRALAARPAGTTAEGASDA